MLDPSFKANFQQCDMQGGMQTGHGWGQWRSKWGPEPNVVVTCHSEFVQMALLLADSFLRMNEKCREETKPKHCPVQQDL